jgi:hypothetical protein
MSAFEPTIVIDPTVNPDEANALAEQLTSPTSGPLPLMPEPPDDVITLPGGYLDSEGILHTTARIREITGADEEAMAREFKGANTNVARVVDIILRRSVLSVGSYEPVPALVLSNLLVGDRSALMLGIRILTFGRDWEVPDFPCQLCGETFGVIVELDTLAEKKLENPMVQEVDVPLRHGRVASMGLLTGGVQLEVVNAERSIPEETTLVIDRCIRRLDGKDVTTPVAKQMGMADRKKIIEALAVAQPGPQLEEVGVECTVCGQEANYALNLMDLFR